MDGHATLEQLRNAPADTVFTERRYSGAAITLEGAEYRGRSWAGNRRAFARAVTTFEQRIRQLEAGFTEPLEN